MWLLQLLIIIYRRQFIAWVILNDVGQHMSYDIVDLQHSTSAAHRACKLFSQSHPLVVPGIRLVCRTAT